MAFEQLTKNVKELTDNTQEYVKTSAEYYKLSLFKNGMKAFVGVANLTVRATFALLFLLFVSIGLAIYIGQEMDNASAGYFIVGAFYFVIFLLVFAFAKKPIEKMLLTKYSRMAFDNDPMTEVSNSSPTHNTHHDESVH